MFCASRRRELSAVSERRWLTTPAGMAKSDRFVLNQETINPNLKEVQYAVRGPVLDRAMEIDRDLQQVTATHNMEVLK